MTSHQLITRVPARYPCIFAILAPLVSTSDRGTTLGRLNVVASLGTVAAFAVCPLLAEHAGWPSMFYLFGTAGYAVCALWLTLVLKQDKRTTTHRPKESDKVPMTSDTDDVSVRAINAAVGRDTVRTALLYLRSPAVIAICFSHMANNFGDAMVSPAHPITLPPNI